MAEPAPANHTRGGGGGRGRGLMPGSCASHAASSPGDAHARSRARRTPASSAASTTSASAPSRRLRPRPAVGAARRRPASPLERQRAGRVEPAMLPDATSATPARQPGRHQPARRRRSGCPSTHSSRPRLRVRPAARRLDGGPRRPAPETSIAFRACAATAGEIPQPVSLTHNRRRRGGWVHRAAKNRDRRPAAHGAELQARALGLDARHRACGWCCSLADTQAWRRRYNVGRGPAHAGTRSPGGAASRAGCRARTGCPAPPPPTSARLISPAASVPPVMPVTRGALVVRPRQVREQIHLLLVPAPAASPPGERRSNRPVIGSPESGDCYVVGLALVIPPSAMMWSKEAPPPIKLCAPCYSGYHTFQVLSRFLALT